MSQNALVFKIGLNLIPGIGPVNARKLVDYFGSPEGVFKASKKNLLGIPQVQRNLHELIHQDGLLKRAEQEIEFTRKYQIRTYFYLDDDYPQRLKHCEDAPVMLFQKGTCDLDGSRIISIVGTRRATQRGRDACEQLIGDLSSHHPGTIIVSGLAHGIDVASHKSALAHNLPTVAVLGHGFNTIYPAIHRNIAKEIIQTGALLTEFLHDEKPEKGHFVQRNRIIAGLADATIVVESGIKGGALITADLANSYNRDVFAFPGRPGDTWSKGCNRLIASNKAALIENIQDLEYIMGWESDKKTTGAIQQELFQSLNPDEQDMVGMLKNEGELTIDQLSVKSGRPVSQVSAMLLNLEFKGVVKSMPGKVYRYLS